MELEELALQTKPDEADPLGIVTARPALTYTLPPGCAVSLLGTLLVAVGGWLRYHPRRIATSPIHAAGQAVR